MRIENDDIARVGCLSVDANQHPTVVFGHGVRPRNEYRFAVLVTLGNGMSLPGAVFTIVADDPAHLRAVRLLDCVNVAVLTPGERLIDARQLDGNIVKLMFAYGTQFQIDDIAPQHSEWIRFETPGSGLETQIPGIAHHFQHN